MKLTGGKTIELTNKETREGVKVGNGKKKLCKGTAEGAETGQNGEENDRLWEEMTRGWL